MDKIHLLTWFILCQYYFIFVDEIITSALFNILPRCSKEILTEKFIHAEILKDYNKDIRPEPSHEEPLTVHFDCRLTKIVKIDVKTQIFIINIFTLMRWRDPSLEWNITTYNGIKTINVGTHLIWTPDVVLYNSANEQSFSHTDVYKTKAVVDHNGTVVWTAPVTWRVSCSFDVTWFPVDMQKCNLTFGSWTYMKNQIHLTSWSNLPHDESMVKSGEWELIEFHSWEQELHSVCCTEPFATIVYSVHLKRLSLYYFLYIILPLVSQVFLFFMVFHIPHDSGERMGFGVTILLSITVYLLVISEKLPEKSDDLPLLGMCFICEFYLLSVALIAAGISINLARKKSKPSRFLMWLLNVCGGPCHRSKDQDTIALEEIPMCETNGHSNLKITRTESITSNNMAEVDPMPSANEIRVDYNIEWKRIANCLDKLFFCFFVVATVLIPVIIVLNLDHSHKAG